MPPESPNPYQPPRTEDCLVKPEIVPELQRTIPPLAPWRLLVAAVLATVGWGAMWAHMNDHFFAGALITVICCQRIPKLLDPDGLRNRPEPLLIVLSIAATAVFIGLLFFGEQIPEPGKEALRHPIMFVFGWMISCTYLLNDWWQRRNNPVHQPKPQAELPSESPWKPLPRP